MDYLIGFFLGISYAAIGFGAVVLADARFTRIMRKFPGDRHALQVAVWGWWPVAIPVIGALYLALSADRQRTRPCRW